MADFLTTLQHFESGGRNIPNVHQGTSSGQAQGFNQITTGTWREFGGLAYAPTPLQATKEQQDAIAAKIPLRRWAPETLAYLRNNGFTLNPNATLAENIAANHGALGVAPPPHTSVPTGASGGTAVVAAPKAPTFGEALKSGNVGDMIKAAITKPPAKTDDKGNEVEQKSPLEKLAGNLGGGAGGQQAAPQIPEMAPAPVVQDPMTGMAQPAAQLYAATAAAAAKPLTWGIKPYGSNAGFQGTTLNATDYNG